MLRPLIGLCLFGAVAITAAGCNDFGYVELKTVPASGRGGAVLYIDGERVDSPRDGIAVLRQAVGTRKLQADPDRQALCDLVVRKDRITTVTVSILERPPRCVCTRSATGAAQERRTCIG
jgi:hypothetical protein